MKHTSVGLLIGGLMLAATSTLAANMPSTGAPSFQPQGLPPATPEQSTGEPLGTLPQQSPTTPGGITEFAPGSSANSPLSPNPPVSSPPARGGG
jgi:hypothetical protein